MLAPLALAFVCAAAAAPAAPAPEGRDAFEPAVTHGLREASPAVRALADSAAAQDGVSLEAQGQLDVERVRRRLGAMQALAGSARPTLRQGPPNDRLLADYILAHASLRFAAALEAAPPPAAVRGVAAGPWHAQREATIRRARWRAAAHLRSCRDLAQGSVQAIGPVCAKELVRVSSLLGAPVAAEPPRGEAGVRAIRAARLPELQGCFDSWAQDRRAGAAPLELTARLGVDAQGRVSSVALAPPNPREAALYDCLADGLWLWVFPGLGEAEIELPLRVGAG